MYKYNQLLLITQVTFKQRAIFFMKYTTHNYTPDEGPGCESSANLSFFMM